MTKLTDTQLIVLSSAAKHDDGLATRPINLHAAAASKVASSLINKGLVREIRAKADAPVWREAEDGRYALKITKRGRDAIGVDDEEAREGAAPPGVPEKSAPKQASSKGSRSTAGVATPLPKRRVAGPASPANSETSSSPQLRPGSKQAIVIDMMMRPKGATLGELIGATDWLPHTTRAALTGLRKRGYAIERTRGEDKITRYRASPPEGRVAEPKQEPVAAAAEALAKAA